MENKNKIDWKRKLSSRKLWLAVAGFVSMLLVFFGASESTATQVSSLILSGSSLIAYILVEGVTDIAGASAPQTSTGAQEVEDEDVEQ